MSMAGDKCAILQPLIGKRTKKNYLGRGEFSKAWLIDGLTVKQNSDSSIYNQDTTYKDTPKEQMFKRSAKTMAEEYDTYQKLKGSPIMPKTLCQYRHGNNRVFQIREYGEIPVVEKGFLPKWKKNSVTRKAFNKFTDEIYRIAKTKGYFDDILQPALRKDGSLFLTDLGFFIEEPLDPDTIINRYMNVDTKLRHFGEQIGLKPCTPEAVIDEHIDYYRKEMADRDWVKFFEKDLIQWQQKKKDNRKCRLSKS